MLPDGSGLSDADIRVLARMHRVALPGSLVTMLGERYIHAFYRYLAQSSDEILFLERSGEPGAEILGACMVSMHPEKLYHRLALRTPLLLYVLPSLKRLPLQAMIRKIFRRAERGSMPQPAGPEIILIFARQELRGNGLGTRLVGRTKTWLRSTSAKRLFVKTQDGVDNRAIRFYEKLGFTRVGLIFDHGKSLVLFEKSIHPDRLWE